MNSYCSAWQRENVGLDFKRPRSDTDGVCESALVCVKVLRSATNEGCEIEVTVTSEQHAQEYNSKLNPIAVIRVAEATHDVLM